MKRRVETQMEWDFTKCGSSKGLATNLPVTPKSSELAPVYLKEVSAYSTNGSTEGRVHIQLDRHFGSDYRGVCPLDIAISNLYHELYVKRIVSGHMGGGPDGFEVGFELSRRENSFCHKAISCVVGIIQELGIQRSEVFYPEILQKTFVWIPKARAPFTDPNFYGWIEYGKWLGSQCRLKDRFSDKILPELKSPTSLI